MKKVIAKIISVLLCIIIIIMPSATVSAVTYDVYSSFLSDEAIENFIDIFYDAGDMMADEARSVLMGEKEGTFEIFSDMYGKISAFYDVIDCDNMMDEFASSMATQTIGDLSKINDVISGTLGIIKNASSFMHSDNAMQSVVDGFQILQGAMQIVGLGSSFPSSLSLILTCTELGLSIAGFLQEQYVQENIELYKAETLIAYYAGSKLPLPPQVNFVQMGNISKEQAESMYAQVYLDFVLRRMMDKIGKSISDPSINGEVYTSTSSPLDIAMNMSVQRNFSLDGYKTVYSSSDTSVLSVNSSTGVVTPVSAGSAYVISNINDKYINRVKVTVHPFDVEYTSDGTSYVIVKGKSNVKTLSIPSNLKGVPISTIGDYAFDGCESLSGVIMPDSVTTIDSYAFYGCESLTSITIPDSVTKIASGVFSGTGYYNDENNWVNDVLYVGNHCIEAKDSIQGICEIKSGTKSIAASAFGGCGDLTDVVIPESVTSIGDFAFSGCINLLSIIVDGKNQHYSNDSYGVLFNKEKSTLIKYPVGNERISYNIPNSVTSIDYGAFEECKSLENIKIPDSVIDIGNYAFSGCVNLTSITIPNGVTKISLSAFSNCKKLTNITIPESVTDIGWYAFKNCDKVPSIVIPNSVTSIGYQAFYGCDSLTSVAIGSGVSEIDRQAFSACMNLTSIVVDNNNPNLSNDEYGVLFNKDKTKLIQFPTGSGITSYIVPNSVKTVGADAFKYCNTLNSIILSNNLTEIDTRAFDSCTKLTGITIPNKVSSIGMYAFYNCSSLTNIALPNSVTDIGSYVFSNCSNLTSVTLSENLTLISMDAFSECISLSKINIPNGVMEISWNAFYNCKNLSSVTLPDTITSIGNAAFYNCDRILSISIPNSVTTIGNNAFYSCNNLMSVIIGDGVRAIGDNAFKGCFDLVSIIMGKSVETIGYGAFNNCSSLTSIVFPISVKRIGSTAFDFCNSLKHVYYEGNIYGWKFMDENPFAFYSGSINFYYECCAHKYNKTEMIQPKCADKGYTTYSCSKCGDKQKCDYVYEFGHKEIVLTSVAPSCTETGLTSGAQCTVCGIATTQQQIIPAKGHNYSLNVTNPTCLEYGSIIRICMDCGIVETETTEALGHDKGVWVVTKKVSCGVDGFKERKCTRCYEVLETAVISAQDHIEGEWVTILNPTCTEAGTQTKRCTVCYTLLASQDIPITEHVESDWEIIQKEFCGADGKKIKKCTLCNEIIKTESIPKTGLHTDGSWEITTKPTNTIVGESVIKCTVCGYVLKSKEIPMLSDTSGFCGNDLLWNYDSETKTLTITGTGAMYDYTATTRPWEAFEDEITIVVIGDEVASIGRLAFYHFASLTSVDMGGIATIGINAFRFCKGLTHIQVGNNVTDINSGAFNNCNALTEVYYLGKEEDWNKISIGDYNESLLNATIHYNYIDPNKFTGIKGDYFYKNDVRQNAYQLVEFEGDYYFINDGHKIAKNKKIYLSERFVEGTDLEVGYYDFDAEGKMILLNGPVGDYFYKDNVRLNAYQLVEFEGNYYFINDGHKIAKNKRIYLSERFVEGTALKVGYYEFDAEGKMVYFNGPVGDYFYKDNVRLKAYQLVEFEGDYYFINDSHKLAKNKRIYLNERFVEGTDLKVGYYEFDAEGKMVYLNGPVGDYFYKDNVRLNAYQLVEFEGDYYFINDSHKLAKDKRLYMSQRFVEGTDLKMGYYEFDADGKMIIS